MISASLERKDVVSMKIERISENQIRCTLSKEELMERQLRVSELAYGSEKAKLLFQEMMQEASLIGFETEDLPLMIEAIPVSSETLVLIVTRIDDAEELDTRFSRFTDVYESEMEEGEFEEPEYYDTGLPEKAASSTLSILDKKKEDGKQEEEKMPEDLMCTFQFSSLEEVSRLSKQLMPEYDCENTLYKDVRKGTYHLLIRKGKCAPDLFNRYCNIASEYGKITRLSKAASEFLREHCKLMIQGDALQSLSKVF